MKIIQREQNKKETKKLSTQQKVVGKGEKEGVESSGMERK